MLIEFKVSNFRSIREEQTLSMVASRADKEHTNSLIVSELPGMSNIKYLPCAAIYGHNASGKTNILLAFKFISEFIKNSATEIKPGDLTGVEPFKLDQDSINEPSKFEISFVAKGVRYLFGLSLTQKRVIEEYLIAYPYGLPQKWYRRFYNSELKKYDWDKPSSYFRLEESLRDITRENSLFLSIGPMFNNIQLDTIYQWFRKEARVLQLSAETIFTPSFTIKMLKKGLVTNGILNLLRSADISVTDATVEEHEQDLESMREMFSEKVFSELSKQKGKTFEVKLSHKSENNLPIKLNYAQEESAGTKRLFALAGPWLDILANGFVVFIDEIETSLHPLIVKELVKLIQNPEINTKGAQVIFTTHSPALLDTEILRRDQIWFTEKDENGATNLYPLLDYKPRKGEAIAKGYLSGRYGAIPFIPEGLKI